MTIEELRQWFGAQKHPRKPYKFKSYLNENGIKYVDMEDRIFLFLDEEIFVLEVVHNNSGAIRLSRDENGVMVPECPYLWRIQSVSQDDFEKYLDEMYKIIEKQTEFYNKLMCYFTEENYEI